MTDFAVLSYLTSSIDQITLWLRILSRYTRHLHFHTHLRWGNVRAICTVSLYTRTIGGITWIVGLISISTVIHRRINLLIVYLTSIVIGVVNLSIFLVTLSVFVDSL